MNLILGVARKGNMLTGGRIKAFDEAKGFGWITPDKGSDDIFFHITALREYGIEIGDHIRFEIDYKNGKDGKPCAKQVKKIKSFNEDADDEDTESLSSSPSGSRTPSGLIISGPVQSKWQALQPTGAPEKDGTDLKDATLDSLTTRVDSFDATISRMVDNVKGGVMREIGKVDAEVKKVKGELKKALKKELVEELEVTMKNAKNGQTHIGEEDRGTQKGTRERDGQGELIFINHDRRGV